MSEDRTPTSTHHNVFPGMRPNPIGGGALEIPDEQWMSEALCCAETDPEAFFVEKGGSTKPAKAICARCDVAKDCLNYALEHGERFGVWGGLSERERRRLMEGRAA